MKLTLGKNGRFFDSIAVVSQSDSTHIKNQTLRSVVQNTLATQLFQGRSMAPTLRTCPGPGIWVQMESLALSQIASQHIAKHVRLPGSDRGLT